MNISYTYEFIGTDIFELEYEVDLREDKALRDDIIRGGIVVYMYIDSVLIGECFGISPYGYMFALNKEPGSYFAGEDDIEDLNMSDNESVYVYSTTILKPYQGRGYGKKLRKEFSKYASECEYTKLLGHATTPSMVEIMRGLGAIFHTKGIHEEWYGTSCTARFYTQFLTQTNDYNCGPFALAYLLETKEHTFSIAYLEKRLRTNKLDGTSPEAIEEFLSFEDIPFKKTEKFEPSSIIDITVGEEGHWVVLIEQHPLTDDWWGYDPDQGPVKFQESYLLNNWVSPVYGSHKGFTLL